MCGRRRWWRGVAVWIVIIAGVRSSLGVPSARAQLPAGAWNDSRAQALVALAVARRNHELGDSGLTEYQADARGYLTFLAQVGPGFPEPPKAVRVDELAVEVYWHAPNISKQRVIGLRDTLLLPADIGYYRDRYGIVEDNFPDSIRLGDGRDVRGVPHPLSRNGPALYDYAIADSLRLVVGGRQLDVYEVRVRPRNPLTPRVIGTMDIERHSGALVRLTITFTRAAILDSRIETLVVTLDNALINGQYWLPQHQEMEVARTGTWLDYPLRGIIRTRWDVCCYQINRPLASALFFGPPIVFMPESTLSRYGWTTPILDSLPADIALVTPADVSRAEHTASAIVQSSALARTRPAAFAAHGISDIVRVDRVEGLALGSGVTRDFGPAWTGTIRARYGTADRQAVGEASATWKASDAVSLRATVYRQLREAGDIVETSGLANSFAAQEFGADNTDPYDVRGAAVGASTQALGLSWHLDVARETQRGVAIHASPIEGRYESTIPALGVEATRATLAVDRLASAGPIGLTWRVHAELRNEWLTPADTVFRHADVVRRGFVAFEADRVFGRDRFVARGSLGAVHADGALPAQEQIFLGGPTSGPGYPFHAFAGQLAAAGRLEWQVPIPVPRFSLGRLGHTPASATVAPFVSADYIGHPAAFRPLPGGWYPAVGLGGVALFDLLRVDVARGLRRPGRWTLWIDVNRDWWGVL